MKALSLAISSIALIIISCILKGYVTSKLWLWFVVSTFNVNPLGITQSIGLAMIVSFLTYQHDQYDDKESTSSEKMAKAIGFSLFYPFFVLFVGWIVKSWM